MGGADAIRAEYCKIAEEARARVRRGLRDTDVPEVAEQLSAVKHKVEAGMVFSRYLTYLAHVKLPPTTMPVPEMNWFVR